jgi:hypothetical protein
MKVDWDVMRQGSRRKYFEIWQRMKKNIPLTGEEKLIGKVMQEHEQFHNTWEFADVLGDVEYDVESEVNPYLHVVVHTIIENQLEQNYPEEVGRVFKLLETEGIDRHEIIHQIGTALLEEIIKIIHLNQPFDSNNYVEQLKGLVTDVRENHHA